MEPRAVTLDARAPAGFTEDASGRQLRLAGADLRAIVQCGTVSASDHCPRCGPSGEGISGEGTSPGSHPSPAGSAARGYRWRMPTHSSTS
ncbi:protein of unknown function [Methylorubrum extorquens DM4]|uniref:Uncharacterized protein n=1 Tax=Methylorubrum extorquens (strain DSM 6343 / CIP 106787 / DM4) TaxID=661410 RepID=C7CGG0_METED|nr:protein of unknown function [Methylorubrum extorquens DM4]